jgi:hypothetical protein
MANRNISDSCQSRPESCPEPLACYEIPDGTGGIAYSFCGCLSSLGFSGPNCDEPSVATRLFIALESILLIVAFAAFIPSLYYVVASFKAHIQAKTRINGIAWNTLVALLALVAFLVHRIVFLMALADGRNFSVVEGGFRVTYL